MMDFIIGYVAGCLVTCATLFLVSTYTKKLGVFSSTVSQPGSPVVSRRTTEKKKPKVQDDQKAWVQEQKEPREIG